MCDRYQSDTYIPKFGDLIHADETERGTCGPDDGYFIVLHPSPRPVRGVIPTIEVMRIKKVKGRTEGWNHVGNVSACNLKVGVSAWHLVHTPEEE